jgi:hypothetical protein
VTRAGILDEIGGREVAGPVGDQRGDGLPRLGHPMAGPVEGVE